MPRVGCVPGGCLPRGCLPEGRLPGGGGSAQGVCVSQHAMGQIPLPPMNRMTDRCKIITLPQTSFAGGKNWSSTRLT